MRLSLKRPRRYPYFSHVAHPPRPGCSHPRTTGSNILLDSGFETSIGFGPQGNEIPGFADIGGLEFPFLNWTDQTQAPPIPSKWWQQDNPGTSSRFFVSDVNPDTGTYHLRQNGFAGMVRNTIYCTTFFICVEKSATWVENPGALAVWQVGQTAVVQTGDVWEINFRAMISSLTDIPALEVFVFYSNSDDTDGQGAFVLNQNLTTSYATFTAGETVPDEATLGFVPNLMSVQIVNDWDGLQYSGAGVLDIDNITLSLTPA